MTAKLQYPSPLRISVLLRLFLSLHISSSTRQRGKVGQYNIMVLPPIFCGVRFRLICFTLFLRKACRDIAARPSRPLYLEVNMALICCDSSGVETEKVLMSRAFPIDPPDNFRSNSPYFTMFSLLPAELRVQIWQHTLPDQRWLSKLPFPRPPVALSICQESRQVALKNLTPLYRDPYAYVNFSCDIIDADFLGDFECTLTETEIASIQNLAIRRFDPESDNPATVWQRNPTYRGWPLCAFRFNCSTPPWGTPDLRGCK
jgi:hypothetical protein